MKQPIAAKKKMMKQENEASTGGESCEFLAIYEAVLVELGGPLQFLKAQCVGEVQKTFIQYLRTLSPGNRVWIQCRNQVQDQPQRNVQQSKHHHRNKVEEETDRMKSFVKLMNINVK